MADPDRLRRQSVRPLPEGTPEAGGPWKVREPRVGESPGISWASREMLVPFDRERGSDLTRAHEVAHVAWTPSDFTLPKATELHWQAAEDARIHLQLHDAGVDLSEGPFDSKGVRTLVKAAVGFDEALALGLAVSVIGTGMEEAAVGALPRRLRARHAEVREVFGDPPASFERTREAAELMTSWYPAAQRSGSRTASLVELAGAVPARRRAHGFEGDRAEIRYLLHDGVLSDAAEYPKRDVPWGVLSVYEPVRPIRLPARKMPSPTRRGFADEGALPLHPHRLTVDGRVFERRRRLPRARGALLIDASGSMNLTVPQLNEIIEAYPLGVVGVYGGRYDTGLLSVVAKRGARAEETELGQFGEGAWGANVVDVPALEWLAEQGEPRIWVSDGVVTGIGDAESPEVSDRCHEICRRGGIKRYKSLEHLRASEPATYFVRGRDND